MQVVEIKGSSGIAEAGHIRREVNLQFLDNVSPGDYVIVHAGFAIQKLDEKEALKTLELFREMERVNKMTESE